MIKSRWPRLCWYIKQHEDRKARNSQEQAHTGPTVSLLRLIFTVLHLGFSSFHNPVICGPQTEKHTHTPCKHELTCKQMIKSNSSQWSSCLCLCCRRTYMSNSTQLIKVCTHGVSEGRIGGGALWFSIFLSAASDPSLSTDLHHH